ncbi:MAG: twin-arginine translocation signal domain-containing protein, partial [Alphaproteobacteria bacterium]|nr:twin-arginine translocation signal domain-containing protein [Alphaproteobacteria bacterium]
NGRRDFLKGAAITAAAATVAATVTKTVSANETMNTTGSGYQKTKHVKTYYETLRF